MATLELVGLRKSFGATPVLHGIDLALSHGEMLVIVGASGCGKSTLLRLIAGLETPSGGRILLDGKDISRLDSAARDMAMVFQNYALYPHMTVFDNVAYGLRVRGIAADVIRRRVNEVATMLDLQPLLGRKPRQLSGGQRQRVAMGRAIARQPKLFLLDEPLSNLDAKLRVQLRGEIRRLQRELDVTSIYVTHDQVEAMTLGDRLLVMHEGRAVQLATPLEVFDRPADTYVATFIGAPAMNLLPATLALGGSAAQLEAGPILPFGDGVRPGPDGHPLTIGIRPEHVQLGSGGLSLRVDLIEPLGSETLIHGRLTGERPAAMVIKMLGPPPSGDTHQLTVDSGKMHVFDAATGVRLEPVSTARSQAAAVTA
jgi:sn-glycerol 3-phosphate transport system ATP-binding protein